MITSTGAASACSVATPTTSSNKQTSTNDDSSTSFHDVMQQHEDSSKSSTQTPSPSASDKASASTTPAATTTTTTPAPATKTAPSATPPAVSDLASMIIQAAVLASNAAAAAKVPATPVSTTATPATPTDKETPPGTDLASLIAQAAPLILGATQYGTAKTSATNVATATTTTTTAAQEDKESDASTSATTSLAVALASILGTAAPVTSTGKDLSATTSGKGSTTAPSKEKKSTASSTEGSFLQSGTMAGATTLSTMNLLGALANAAGNTSVNQTLTPTTGAKNSSLSTLANSAISAAGTANVEKEKDMNSTLTTSATELLSASGANTLVTPKPADLQVQLSSNHDFTDALKQVMHVAQLTQTAESRTPMRVEMTVQTPPGAVVNIYVSKTGDQFRAQLGSNDPVALAWVQTQITSLKSNDLGVDVKWLPPQMESGTPTITTSGSQDANLSWNQGGGQSGYQQPDDRRQGSQDDDAETEYAGANPFMSTLNSSLGRAS